MKVSKWSSPPQKIDISPNRKQVAETDPIGRFTYTRSSILKIQKVSIFAQLGTGHTCDGCLKCS